MTAGRVLFPFFLFLFRKSQIVSCIFFGFSLSIFLCCDDFSCFFVFLFVPLFFFFSNTQVRAAREFPNDLVRLSIGIESAEDLIADLTQAMQSYSKPGPSAAAKAAASASASAAAPDAATGQ